MVGNHFLYSHDLNVFDSVVKLLGEVGHQPLLGYMGVKGCTTKYMYI